MYRDVPKEALQQKISELEKEIHQLKFRPDEAVPEKSKKASVVAKTAVMLTMVIVGLVVAIYYLGIIRAIAILWQIMLYVLVGGGLLIFAVAYLPIQFIDSIERFFFSRRQK